MVGMRPAIDGQDFGRLYFWVCALEDGEPWCILVSATEWAGWLRREERLRVLDWFFSSRCPASFCGSIAGHPGARISQSLPELQKSRLALRRNRVACSSSTKSSSRARLSRPRSSRVRYSAPCQARGFPAGPRLVMLHVPIHSIHLEQNGNLNTKF